MVPARAHAWLGRLDDARRLRVESAEMSAASGLTVAERQAREILALR